MKNRNSTFSLTVMIVIMAVLAVFVGYLLGNWLIQMVTGDTDTHQVMDNKIIEEEERIEDNNENSNNENGSSINIEDDKIMEEETIKEQIRGEVFAVQVGAFKNYENALDLKNELESKGFQVVVTENSPYKVQLGATTNREEAEEIEDRVEALGYNAFITH